MARGVSKVFFEMKESSRKSFKNHVVYSESLEIFDVVKMTSFSNYPLRRKLIIYLNDPTGARFNILLLLIVFQ